MDSWFIKVEKAGSIHAGTLTRETFGVFPEIFQNIQVALLFLFCSCSAGAKPPFAFGQQMELLHEKQGSSRVMNLRNVLRGKNHRSH